MAVIRVHNTLDDLAGDAERAPKRVPTNLARVVEHNIVEGNRIARANASEQHTMFGDEDIEYPPSFTSEMTGVHRGEFGPDADIGDGSQAEGYEHGSINSPPHNDMGRAFDVIRPSFGDDVGDLAGGLYW